MVDDDRLVKSANVVHSATQLCEGGKSVGPDIVSLDEKRFCDMKTKTLYDFCGQAEDVGECWDNVNNVLTNGTAGVSAFGGGSLDRVLSKYSSAINWEYTWRRW